jgi:predicted acyl esterase
VDDGVSLAADVYAPKKSARYPAIVAFSAYSKELQSGGVPTGSAQDYRGAPAFPIPGSVPVRFLDGRSRVWVSVMSNRHIRSR